MKKIIVLLALVSFILSSFATSASFSFMGPSNRQGCQCDQIIYYAEIVNDEPNSRTFYLSVEGLSTAAFSYFVVPDVEVKSSSSEQVAIFVTPRCDAPPGNYNFAVKARTGSMVHSIEGVATVSDCHYLTMEITPPQKLCAGDTATYVISLKNEGNFPESGSISTNLNPQIYSLSETGFSLNPSQSKDFYLYVTPPAGMPSGNSGFKVLGRSQYTYREAVSSLNVLSCVDLKISVPASINAQAGEETRAKAEFTNTGSVSDAFLLSLSCPPFVSLKDYKINLNASQSASTQLVIYPGKENPGIYSCTIIARAQKYIKEFTAKTSINAQQFYTATLSTVGVQGNMVKACKGEQAIVSFDLFNSGREDTYDLSSIGVSGTLSITKVAAASNTRNPFTLMIDTSAMKPGVYPFSVSARSSRISLRKELLLAVEDCYASALSVVSTDFSACAGDVKKIMLQLRNTGTKEDSFSIITEGDFPARASPASFSVGPNSSKSFELIASIPDGTSAGMHSLKVTAKGITMLSATVPLNVLPVSQCHGISLNALEREKKIEVCKGSTFEVTVKNTGKKTESIEFSVEGVTWAFVNPRELTLAPGESRNVYVYFSPPFSTKLGKYALSLTARSQLAMNQLALEVSVFGVGELGQQLPAGVVSMQLTSFPSSIELEKGVEKDITFTVRNNGASDLHGLMAFLPVGLEVLSQTPVDLKAGEEKTISVLARGTTTLPPSSGELRIVSRETTNETQFVKQVQVSVSASSLNLETTSQEILNATNETALMKIVFTVSNKGNRTTLRPSLKDTPGAVFNPIETTIDSNETKELTLLLSMPIDSEKNYTLSLLTERGAYRFEEAISSKQPSGLSGFAVAATSFGIFLIALLIGILVIYRLTKRSGAEALEEEQKEELKQLKEEITAPPEEVEIKKARRPGRPRKKKVE